MSSPQQYGLIGLPLSHSFSAAYFTEKFAQEGIPAVYNNYELPDINTFPALIAVNPSLRGLNVTIPYKSAIIPFLDHLSDTAREVGAVNTIVFRDNILTGHNTDVEGFAQSISPLLNATHKKALVLGSGGASKAIIYALSRMSIETSIVNRDERPGQLTYEQLDNDIMDSHTLVINCTPLGTFPNIEDYPPVPFQFLTPRHLVVDLVYNPKETAFMQKAKANGAAVKNGYEMLILQAEAAWRLWNE